jgi:hypothetical protein
MRTVLWNIGAAVRMRPVEPHAVERLRRSGAAVEPETVAGHSQRLLPFGQPDLDGADCLFLLVSGVRVAAHEHFRHQLWNPEIQYVAGPDLLGRQLPELLLGQQHRLCFQTDKPKH